MSQRFIRCPHCALPHDGDQEVCPAHRAGDSRDPPSQAAVIAATPPPSSRRAVAGHLLGKTIGGKYRVRGVLGEGGMGTVFEAEHIALGRSVAVKVLHATQATKKDAVRRFQQEARAAGAIGHPNICGVIDLGTLDDGSPYLVMERLVGETLADRVAAEGGLPFEDVIDILIQVLSGLVAAHEKGIVHRDIKPENIFLTQRVGCPPLVKLLDFGVSKMTGGRAGAIRPEDLALTRTGMVMGTPYYMAPEQARGERDLDARVDLYACGVILYEALTGRRPFTAANYNALLMQILTATPRSRKRAPPGAPARVRRRPREGDGAAPRGPLRHGGRFPARPAGAARPQSAPPGPPSPRSSGALARTPPRPRPLDVPSSVTIPITFVDETPAGVWAVDPTDVHSRLPEGGPSAEGPASADSGESEDGEGDPTQLMASAKPRRS